MPDFQPGQVLKLSEEALNESWPRKRWEKARFKVIQVLGGPAIPMLRIERLDLPSHPRQNWQNWSQKWFVIVEE